MNIDTIEMKVDEINIQVVDNTIKPSLTKVYDKEGIVIYDFEINNNKNGYIEPITLQWKIPAINVKGVWKPTTDFAKRIQADWELDHMESRISIDSPVISLFGNNDENVLTFACANAIDKLEMNARIREEDNYFYCHITFFSEQEYKFKKFKTHLRLDYRNILFSNALMDVSQWWETFEVLKPAYVPAIAKEPLYSTWYQFHQDLDIPTLLKECKIASSIGYKAIIIDDGWQTNDNNRGYDYTGDWQPDRIPEMAPFVSSIHNLDMKVALWYSVPFCGKKSKAYKKFKGKFLTEDHRWAPVFDPRYPEIRAYLINIYANAVKDWKLDGLKLDFIDDFRLYKDTPLGKENGRDYGSINLAVDRLLTDVINTLQVINPEIFIEFRQKYIGPAMRKYGNMLRAFDCPGDATMNRVRIADIKMLCGNTAVHSDMITWHVKEPIEVAALQMVNTLFGVPQVSVMLHKIPQDQLNMVSFYTEYWKENASVLMEGNFIPSKPLANYPIKQIVKNNHRIIGVYDEYVITLNNKEDKIDVINAQLSTAVVLKISNDLGIYKLEIYNCKGSIVNKKDIILTKGLIEIETPACGLLRLTLKK